MSTLNVIFNKGNDATQKDIYIGFVSGSANNEFNISYKAGDLEPLEIDIKPLNTVAGHGNWYTYEELKEGVQITNFSGRIYVCFSQPWKVLDAYYEPAQNITDENFFLRYDKMELTFNGAATDVADLTSIDYWSIPMKLETSLNGATPVQTDYGLKQGVSTTQVYNALSALTQPPKSGLANAKPALVPGSFKQHSDQPGSGFARIIGPSSYPPVGGVPITPYHLFDSYLTYLNDNFGTAPKANAVSINGLGKGVIANIAGHFNGVGPNVPSSGSQSPQDYNLTAIIDDSLDISLSGTVGGNATTMLYKKEDLINPNGIYGANAMFSLNGAAKQSPANNVYGWITGDLLAGFNIGAIGSTTSINGTQAGAMKSSNWFSKIPNTELFGNLQNNKGYYNEYAETLQELSDAYNFAYSDRFSAVQVSLDPAKVNTLEVSFFNVEVPL
ncbi:beta-1,3-glucanase family protein [uncultured Tenacibaculum sp.]|uniref:beta-1,3-glucanase family protein n=1 Tax=uncultured Tenacibaculum sp. TaxID=174713 RepID=UPI00260A3F75|nr:beta-1,3-glucanase family protein [uncultured Tenacibaculum sp.]